MPPAQEPGVLDERCVAPAPASNTRFALRRAEARLGRRRQKCCRTGIWTGGKRAPARGRQRTLNVIGQRVDRMPA
jgi:hypothetical protein